MDLTFDNYILSRKYSVYFALGHAFASKKDALEYALIRLSKQGSLVEMMALSVPDCACDACGEMLFDWQHTVGELAGTSGSDNCYYSLANGLVCEVCAYLEAETYVTEQVYRGSDLAQINEMRYLL